MKKTLYLAYGSNMCRIQMKERCINAIFLKTVRIEGFEFLINSLGVATIIKSPNSYIEGVIWELTEVCEYALDKYECVSTGEYLKEYLTLDNHQLQNVLVYIASDFERNKPRPGYLEKICLAAQKEQLSPEYLDILKTHF